MEWAYGVTTTPIRRESLLLETLTSLCHAGFDKPRLFVDGCPDPTPYNFLGLEITTHYPALRTFGNWVLSLWELYVRQPHADRYAIFQDDFITYRNLKQYLESCQYPVRGYWNLYTFPQNQVLAPENGKPGWYRSNQLGKGAVALVFNQQAVMLLLQHYHMVFRPQSVERGHRFVDGGIVTAFKKSKWQEYVHNPSLVQHTGIKSSMGNKKQPLAVSFKGQDFNALELLLS